MEKMVGISVVFAGILFFAPLAGALIGAFCGWVVGLFFADVILGTLTKLGLDTQGLAMWQLGMTLGFVGGFFKATLTADKSK